MDVFELEDQIRELVNEPRLHQKLMQDMAKYNQLCASMDVIADTQWGILAFMETDFETSLKQKPLEIKGIQYLITYGLLQLLFVQQDAIRHLAEALSITLDITQYPNLSKIRDLRNQATGHPTRQGENKKKPTFSHFIVQMSLSQAGFELMSVDNSGVIKHQQVNTKQIILEQEVDLIKVLIYIKKTLIMRDKEHKEMFKGQPLAVFWSDLTYQLGKLSGISNKDKDPRVMIAITSIREKLDEFEKLLLKRDITLDTYELKRTYELIRFALNKLELLDGNIQSSDDEKLATIFVQSIQHYVEGIKKVAKSIDDEYNQD